MRAIRLARAFRARRAVELLQGMRTFRSGGAVLRAYLRPSAAHFPLALETRRGTHCTLHEPHDVVTAWVVWARREYPAPADARCIVDLGANYGAFTLFAAERAPHAAIVSVEPHPETFARLTAHVAANALQARVHCLNVAVAAHAGSRWMSSDPADATPSRGIYPEGSTPDRAHAYVDTLPLHDVLQRARTAAGTHTIDVLKIDVEGAEHELIPHIAGGALDDVRTLAMEYHPNAPRTPLFNAIEAAGMHCIRDRLDFPDTGVAWFTRR